MADQEMINRVADAIRLRDTTDEFAMARAAIEAMREPPKGFEKIVYHGDYGDDVWREMIDSILK